MIVGVACLDVRYLDTRATAAGVVFDDWTDASPNAEQVVCLSDVQPYQPGQFFRRELPCLLAVLQVLPPGVFANDPSGRFMNLLARCG